MKKNHFIILALLPVLTSCFSPKPVLRFKAEETNTTWDKGKEYISYKKGDYEVHTSYYGNNDDHIMFDIEIVNKNGEEFLVAPENIKLYTGWWDNVKQSIEYSNSPISAIDPEMELLKIDLENSKAEAASKNAGVAAVAIFAAAVPLAIIAAKSDADNSSSNTISNESTISNSEMVGAGVNLALAANEVNHDTQEYKIESLNDSKYTWETSSLRKTTLSPGYSIRGLVFFPTPDIKFRKVRIDVPLPNGIISIKYDYLIYYPQ